ncbi:MAG TPA: hypothetical protein PK765_02665 [bacterium]|nr:hypothetical protein [bacterium]
MRLKKENEDCLKIIGELMVVIDRLKKTVAGFLSSKYHILLAREICVKYPEIPLRLIARTVGVSRNSVAYRPMLPEKDEAMGTRIMEVHASHPHYGHQRVAWELGINKKRTYWVMKEVGIRIPSRKRKAWVKPGDRNFSRRGNGTCAARGSSTRVFPSRALSGTLPSNGLSPISNPYCEKSS